MAFEQYMWIIWLAAFIIFLVVEGLNAELVTIWFAFGSVLALIISFIPGVAWWVELIVFIVVSVASLLALRPLLKKLFRGRIVSSNADSLIGKKTELLDRIGKHDAGYVKIADVKWRAISVNEGEVIEEGEIVEIVAINGNKLLVKKANEEREVKPL